MNRSDFFGYLAARRRARVRTLPVFLPTRASLELARRRYFLPLHERLSRQVFDARHRVSPGRSEGWLCPSCDLPLVLERGGDHIDASGRRGTFQLWHEAPMCEAFGTFNYKFVVASELPGRRVARGRDEPLPIGELGADAFKVAHTKDP